MGKVIHWELCKKLKCDDTTKSYMHKQGSVIENETYKILWDFEIEMDHVILARRPDLVLKRENLLNSGLYRSSGPQRENQRKKKKKKDKYLDLARELRKLWNTEMTVIPIVIRTLGTVLKRVKKWTGRVKNRKSKRHNPALLRLARILRRVLET